MIYETDVIDLVSYNISKPDTLVLSQTDHTTWGLFNYTEHLLLLQENVNTCLAYITNEQYKDKSDPKCPADNPELITKFVIQIAFRHKPPAKIHKFFRDLNAVTAQRNAVMKYVVCDKNANVIFEKTDF